MTGTILRCIFGENGKAIHLNSDIISSDTARNEIHLTSIIFENIISFSVDFGLITINSNFMVIIDSVHFKIILIL